MPFVRFSRDKRGYEHLYLVESVLRRGKSRNRILYWYRTPPDVKIGRLPFDDLVKRTLEAQYPAVSFDWQQLIDTPIPPPAPDVERWRERRRAEKAAKLAAATEAAAEAAAVASEEESPTEEPAASIVVDDARVGATAPVPEAGTPSEIVRKRRRRHGARRGRPDKAATPPAAGESMPLPPTDSAEEPDEE